MLRLNDGRSVAIRPILPTDLSALRAFYAALAPRTRALRFHISVNELPEDMLQRFTAVDGSAHVAFVAEDAGAAVDRPRALVAEARYVRQTDSDSAEFAVVVADGWHRAGLGTLLVQALLRNARFAGVSRLCGDVLTFNKGTQDFLDFLGARPAPGEGDSETVRLCLEPQAA